MYQLSLPYVPQLSLIICTNSPLSSISTLPYHMYPNSLLSYIPTLPYHMFPNSPLLHVPTLPYHITTTLPYDMYQLSLTICTQTLPHYMCQLSLTMCTKTLPYHMYQLSLTICIPTLPFSTLPYLRLPLPPILSISLPSSPLITHFPLALIPCPHHLKGTDSPFAISTCLVFCHASLVLRCKTIAVLDRPRQQSTLSLLFKSF